VSRIRTAAARRALFQLKVGVDAAIALGVQHAAEKMVEKVRAQRSFKDRSHKTRDSAKAQIAGPYRWRFKIGGAAGWLNSGTGLWGPKRARYRIPKLGGGSGKILRFVVAGGRVLFRRFVMHPGIQPTHFIDKARDEVETSFRAQTVRELNVAIREHNK
jgi:hypothetical protein